MNDLVFSPNDFVAVLNQTLEYAYPNAVIAGELANFRVNRNRWVYFDLKDEFASVKFFGTVYQLPGPLEDGMLVQVRGAPRLHPQYGFSVTIQSIQPVGEGSLRRAAALLEAKLAAEGLFDPGRKRPLPFPPKRIGLITSGESAAYADFIKILGERWGGLEVFLADVQVQGEAASGQIMQAIEYFNSQAKPVDILVLTRGGGSAEDLAAFSTEQVTRAVAASRIPTLVAIGHEVDISLAELAADQRASTPSNAAQLLVPDRTEMADRLPQLAQTLEQSVVELLHDARRENGDLSRQLTDGLQQIMNNERVQLNLRQRLLTALDPAAALKRGYAIVRQNGRLVRSAKGIKTGQKITIQMRDAQVGARVEDIAVQ